MRTNLDLGFDKLRVLFCESDSNTGIRIVAEGIAGWGTRLTIETAKPDRLGDLTWSLQSETDYTSEGQSRPRSVDAEALLSILIQRDSELEELERLRSELAKLKQDLKDARDDADDTPF